MQENWLQIINAFIPTQRYVLATIVKTKGSTYQKVGTMMLIDEQGVCTGLLSGGCLEADISLHAQSVFSSQSCMHLQYDLSNNADLLWGLGLGCDGALEIMLQPLSPENNYAGFTEVLSTIAKRITGYYCIDINALENNNTFSLSLERIPEEITKQGLEHLLVIPIIPPIGVLICGAGPDAQPVVNLSQQLGWQVSIWDHRQGHLDQSAFHLAHAKRKIRPSSLSELDSFSEFDAVIIMTHNLESDAEYLARLLKTQLGYIGVLGPQARRDKLLKMIGKQFSEVEGRVFGPIGLDIGGRGPQSIALSIAAQIQQQLSKQRTSKNSQPFIYPLKEDQESSQEAKGVA